MLHTFWTGNKTASLTILLICLEVQNYFAQRLNFLSQWLKPTIVSVQGQQQMPIHFQSDPSDL